MSELESRIIIISADEEFKSPDIISNNTTPKPILVSSLRECQRFLSDKDFDYVGAFINPKMGHPAWIACIKSCHQYRPGMAIYVVYDDIPKITQDQLKQIGVTGYKKLPLDYDEMLKILNGDIKVEKNLAIPQNQKPAQTQSTPKPSESHLKDSDVIAVNLENRVGNTTSQFDLYIKLTTGKYVQVLKSGDRLTKERIDKYREHGAEALYIPKNQNNDFLNFCDKMVSDYLKDPKVPFKEKSAEVARYGDETVEFLRLVGIHPLPVSRAQQFVSKVTESISQLELSSSSQVKEWVGNVAALEHSVGVCTIAGLVLKNIGVVKPETYNHVGLACFFHDIGLLNNPVEFLEEDESKMDAEEKTIYWEHPLISSKILAEDNILPPGILKAVEQHHMRSTGKGFPKPKGTIDLSPIAEIIGIADEFYYIMKKVRKDPNIDPIKKITEIANRDFSKIIAQGFLDSLKGL